MQISRNIIVPSSKRDSTLPYTYLARVDTVPGQDDLTASCFCDTICGLVEYLEKNNIAPADTALFGVYMCREIPLDKSLCVDENGAWLPRPDICHSLEQRFAETGEIQYKGHHEHVPCEFEDRDRRHVLSPI